MDRRIPIISETDAGRIRELCARLEFLRGAHAGTRELLEKVAEEAEIVPARHLPADVVSIGSEVTFRDRLTDSIHRVSVVHPDEASHPERRISVLSPVGCALLGRRVGDVPAFAVPDGSRREIEILALHGTADSAAERA